MKDKEAEIEKGDTRARPEGVKWYVSRRSFLIGLGVTGATLALSIPFGLPLARRQMARMTEGGFSAGNLDPLAWFEIRPENHIRLYLTKAELGQGVHTALAQIAADELEVPWENLEVVHASTNQSDGKFSGTAGSMSVKTLYMPLRRAAATLREMLRAQAATILGQPVEELVARKGGIEVGGNPTERVSYSEIASHKVDWQVPKKEVPLKPEDNYRLIGSSLQRVDIPAKTTGKAVFGYDARLEGMLFGAVARPPTISARMISAETGRAVGMPGVERVVVENDFVGVVARSQIQAEAARDALEIEWDRGHQWQQEELEKLVTIDGSDGVTIQSKGRASSVLRRGVTLESEYSTCFAAHASLEPQAALADVKANSARVWTSTQHEYAIRTGVAEAIGVDPDQVEIVPQMVGGGFGRKSGSGAGIGAAAEAAILSKAVGKPVRVNWNRAEEMRCGYFRPFTRHTLSATLDGNGRIEAMENHQASGDALLNFLPNLAARIIGFDFGAARGTLIPYAVPNRKVTVWRHQVPIPTGPWRGVGLLPNIFPLESFMDELAFAAGVDPLQFRLDHLSSDTTGRRMRAVLEAAADSSGWGKSLSSGHARGLACCDDADTMVAEVAEISLDRRNNRIRVHRVVAAIDCGRVINPDGVIAQVEGAVTMGVSAALLEEIKVKEGRVEAENFDRYPLLRMGDAPAVEAILLEAPDGKPRGVGEPPIGPIAPAIGNAFYTLTGKRLRELPMTPERIEIALGS